MSEILYGRNMTEKELTFLNRLAGLPLSMVGELLITYAKWHEDNAKDRGTL